MTIKELSDFTGKNRTTVERWCAKCTSNEIKNKVQNAHKGNPSDFSLDEIELILNSSSMSKDAVSIIMENARKSQTKDLIIKTEELDKELIIQQAMIFQQEKIRVLTIKAQVADKIANTEGLLLPSSVGKLISGEPYKFCQWLVDNKIMFRKGRNDTLMPYSQYDKKYFDVKISTYKQKSTFQSYFTPRGVLWVQAKYFKTNGLLQLDCSENI